MIYSVRFFVCSDYLPNKNLEKYKNGNYTEFNKIANICIKEQCCADIKRNGIFVGSVIESGLFIPTNTVLDI